MTDKTFPSSMEITLYFHLYTRPGPFDDSPVYIGMYDMTETFPDEYVLYAKTIITVDVPSPPGHQEIVQMQVDGLNKQKNDLIKANSAKLAEIDRQIQNLLALPNKEQDDG